jgi:AraC-like DNA-binding protein
MPVASHTFTPRQHRCARYLALGMSQGATARRMAMSDRQIRRWLTEVEGFSALVEEYRAAGTCEQAEDALLDALSHPDPRVRIAAARELRRAPAALPAPEDEDADLLAGWK